MRVRKTMKNQILALAIVFIVTPASADNRPLPLDRVEASRSFTRMVDEDERQFNDFRRQGDWCMAESTAGRIADWAEEAAEPGTQYLPDVGGKMHAVVLDREARKQMKFWRDLWRRNEKDMGRACERDR